MRRGRVGIRKLYRFTGDLGSPELKYEGLGPEVFESLKNLSYSENQLPLALGVVIELTTKGGFCPTNYLTAFQTENTGGKGFMP